MKQNIRTLAAIMICGIALAACSDKDNDDNTNIVNPAPATVETESKPSLPQSCTLTINATKGKDASLSKALALSNEGKTLTASWKQGEIVAVYNGDTKIGELTAQSDGASTTLSGSNLTPAPSANDKLTLKFNETDYSGQDGTLATIASTYDYATAAVTVASVSADGNITIEESAADFENQQAIVKFTLSSDGAAINATSLKVNDLTINLDPASATNEVFVAIPGGNAKNINLTVDNGSDKYVFYKANVNFENGKYYAINVKNLVKSTTFDLAAINENTIISNGAVLTGTLSGNHKISIAAGATVTLNDVTIEGENNDSYKWAGITCEGDATIILEGDNTVKGFYQYYPGIFIAEGATLTIDGTGTLDASSNGVAGIGSSVPHIHCGNIIINGGTISATGGETTAGIGSCPLTTCGTITINGGTVTATGGDNAAGIGSGEFASCGTITINGGTVTATGGMNGAGIGSGINHSSCGNITISGGTVTATGGDYAAGIGSGGRGSDLPSSCGDITITAGVEQVIATKGNAAPYSIGAGDQSTCGTVTIEEGANVEEY